VTGGEIESNFDLGDRSPYSQLLTFELLENDHMTFLVVLHHLGRASWVVFWGWQVFRSKGKN